MLLDSDPADGNLEYGVFDSGCLVSGGVCYLGSGTQAVQE